MFSSCGKMDLFFFSWAWHIFNWVNWNRPLVMELKPQKETLFNKRTWVSPQERPIWAVRQSSVQLFYCVVRWDQSEPFCQSFPLSVTYSLGEAWVKPGCKAGRMPRRAGTKGAKQIMGHEVVGEERRPKKERFPWQLHMVATWGAPAGEVIPSVH